MPLAELHCTLLSDGSSDRALVPILRWLLHCHLPDCPVQLQWGDLRLLPQPPKQLPQRIAKAIQLYPCELLFVHRDAEGISADDRRAEIDDALKQGGTTLAGIAVVPVRMMETWLLIDGPAIRKAANNPNGQGHLNLPTTGNVESIPDPKNMLHNLIREATELSARRKRGFDVHSAVHRIPEYMEDFSRLRRLSAFAHLEEQIIATIHEQGWGT